MSVVAVDAYVGNPKKDGPYTAAVALTTSDTDDLVNVSNALLATVAGVIKVTMKNGVTCVIPIAAGIALKVRASRVWATGTTATGIVALQ